MFSLIELFLNPKLASKPERRLKEVHTIDISKVQLLKESDSSTMPDIGSAIKHSRKSVNLSNPRLHTMTHNNENRRDSSVNSFVSISRQNLNCTQDKFSSLYVKRVRTDAPDRSKERRTRNQSQ